MSAINTIPLNSINKLVPVHKELEQPILLLGKPGIGKSFLFKDVAEKMNYELIDIRLSTYDEADLNVH